MSGKEGKSSGLEVMGVFRRFPLKWFNGDLRFDSFKQSWCFSVSPYCSWQLNYRDPQLKVVESSYHVFISEMKGNTQKMRAGSS